MCVRIYLVRTYNYMCGVNMCACAPMAIKAAIALGGPCRMELIFIASLFLCEAASMHCMTNSRWNIYLLVFLAAGTQHVQTGILRNSSVTLHYYNGSCKWIITVVELFEIEIGEGKESTITRQTTNLFNDFGWKCEANGTLLLDAAFTVYGKLNLMFLL